MPTLAVVVVVDEEEEQNWGGETWRKRRTWKIRGKRETWKMAEDGCEAIHEEEGKESGADEG